MRLIPASVPDWRGVPQSLRAASHATTVVGVVLGMAVLWALWQFGLRLAYEAHYPFTADTPIYEAVGRGILNGLTPWRDLFETKPPGIFLLCAASFALTGGEWLLHALQVVALVVIAVAPLLLGEGHGTQAAPQSRWMMRALLLLLGLLLALYAAERAGEVQVESFGAAAAVLALLGMAGPFAARWPRGALALATLGWLGACGLKEPFVFPLLGAAILLLRTPREWLQRCLLPLGLAVCIGALVLACLGWLGSYGQDYLAYMVGHTAQGGSPWRRALELGHVWRDMNGYAAGLGWVACALAMANVLLVALRSRHHEELSSMALRTGLAALAGSLAVGMGGEYYNHHHVFALPVVLALAAALVPHLLAQQEDAARFVWSGLTVLLCAAALALPMADYQGRLAGAAHDRAMAQADARYVDAVLDAAHLQRYLFVGGNGPQLYAYTRHSPLGPMFFQLDEFAEREALREQFFVALAGAQLVVVDRMAPALAGRTAMTLARDFTRSPWPEATHAGRDSGRYAIWFRRRDGGLVLAKNGEAH